MLKTKEKTLTLVDMLERVAKKHPEKGMTIIDEAGKTQRQSYVEICANSKRVAAGWLEFVKKGDRILFSMPTSFDFFIGFFGALRIGAIPVPIAPLKESLDASDRAEFLWRMTERMQAKALLVGIHEQRSAKPPELGVLESVVDISMLLAENGKNDNDDTNPIAYIQTTSGATGTRQGAILDHLAILKNIEEVGKGLGANPADVACSWLPMYNVLGLIGVALFSMFHGMEHVLIDPGSFSKNPDQWLQAMSQYRATLSIAPSHAYHFAARRTSRSQVAELDLSSIRALIVGGESVRKKHVEMFQKTFAEAGLPASIFASVYGLSEATMGVTLGLPGPLKSLKISREALEKNGDIQILNDGVEQHRFLEFLSCGRPIHGVQISITDERGIEKPPLKLGFITIKSQTLMSDYFPAVGPGRLARSNTRRSGDWLITDDMGFIYEDELYPVAQSASVISTQDGHLLFAHEMEYRLYEIDGIRLGSSIIFNADPVRFKLVVAVEVEPGANRGAIRKKVLESLYRSFRLRPDKVEMVSPNSIPRSPNGKIRRHLVALFYKNGVLERQKREAEFDGIRRLIQRSRHSIWRWLRKKT